MLRPGAVARFTTFPVDRTPRYRLFAMYRFDELVVLRLMAIFARLGADEARLSFSLTLRNE